MKMKYALPAATLLVSWSFCLAQAGVRTPHTFTLADETTQRLEHLQASAAFVQEEAGELIEAVQDPTMDAAGHQLILNTLKERINEMGREAGILNEERKDLPRWERNAIVRTIPLLKDAAAETTHALDWFNANKADLWAPAYEGYAYRLRDDSTRMTQVLGDYLKLAKLHQEEHQVDNALRTPAGK
ncbi:MAG: hypothetical protein IT165_29755 [Bryobacterales bacterium]|nr:hypothetical protein [Bryobacterales bacterium]